MGVRYRTEAQLRDALAEVAFLAGWYVTTERHVPGWGRIDLVLDCGAWYHLVELKLALKQPRDIRRALQQADGYRRSDPHAAAVLLVAADISPDMAHYADAYPEVTVWSVERLLGHLRTFPMEAMHRTAAWRREDLERRLRLAEALEDPERALARYTDRLSEVLS